jgi:plastocyanin
MHSVKNTLRSLKLESLENRRLMAVVAESEPNNRKSLADVAIVSSSESTNLVGSSSKKDKDFFAVTFQEAGVYNVGSSDALVKINVEDTSGVKRLETEPNDDITSGLVEVVAGEKLWFRVRGVEKETAAYDVAIQAIGDEIGNDLDIDEATSMIESEPNNRKRLANSVSISADSTSIVSGTTNKRDKDFFKLTFAEAGTYRIGSDSAIVKLSIENQVGDKLLETEPKDDITFGTITVAAGESVWLRVRGIEDSDALYSVAIERVV